MSQEEFDNRLKSSFEDEYLPPGEHLWANITDKLDKHSGKPPVWYWVLPLVLVVVSGMAWLAVSFSNKQHGKLSGADKQNMPIESNRDRHEQTASAETETGLTQTPENTATAGINDQLNTSARPAGTIAGIKHKRLRRNTQTGLAATGAYADINHSDLNGILSGTNPNNENPANATTIQSGIESPAAGNSSKTIEWLSFLRASGFKKFLLRYSIPEIPAASFSLFKPALPKKPEKKGYRQNSSFAELTSKHWLNFGIGPQQSVNRLVINEDSQAWVHRHLWDNKYKMTGNGIGLNAFVSYAYKFGKKQRFSFESGIEYNLRTENIRMNENTYDIASRDSLNKIQKYVQVILLQLVVYNPITGKNDTTNYLAASNFSMAVSNRYHAFTVPFHLNAEFKLSENTFLSAGLGGGLSIISSKTSEHLDMVWGETKKQAHTRMYTGSLSSRVNLFTNFNDFGQIGIYTGYKLYVSPWEVNTGQYAIRMSDLQFGITFRKPL